MSVNRSAPMQINLRYNNVSSLSKPYQIGLNTWSKVSAGNNYSLGITNIGALFGWGINSSLESASFEPYTSWRSISVGRTQTLGIKSDYTLWGWGNNIAGQLGNGLASLNATPSPVLINGFYSWNQVSAGEYYSTAIRTDGRLYAWGNNIYGQLGQNNIIFRSFPVQIGTSSWTSVSTGPFHMLAVRSDGRLFGWGLNNEGQLGINPQTSQYFTSVANSSDSSFGVKNDGSLWAWGRNTAGQLGLSDTSNKSIPVQIGTSSWSMVTAGTAIRSDGALFAWGSNSIGQLGDGTTISKSSPVQIGTSSWIQVSRGVSHCVAIRSDGAMFAWGKNLWGQLGINADFLSDRSSPVQIGTSSWSQVYADTDTSYAISRDGGLFAWGMGNGGELGNSSVVNISSPVQIGTSSWTLIRAGATATANGSAIGITVDGRLFTWGNNDNGQLGLGNIGSRSSPTQVGSDYIDAGTNYYTSYAIKNDYTLWVWGSDITRGNDLGAGFVNINSFSNTPFQLGNDSWVALGTNMYTPMAINNNKSLYAWGNNSFGQVGTGSTIYYSSPIVVGNAGVSSPTQVGTSSWSAVAAGEYHSLALTSNKRLFAFGDNNYGQLGVQNWQSFTSVYAGPSTIYAIRTDNLLFGWGNDSSGQLQNFNLVNQSSPIQLGLSSWRSITSSNENVNLGIKTDYTLWAWGDNSNGLFGNGSTITSYSPVQIGISSWNQVSASTNFVTAIRIDGALFTWGFNTFGQLGNNGIANYSWSQISAGYGQSLAIRSDGILFAWGFNSNGQIGDSSTEYKSSPVQIGISSWVQISAGYLLSAAIRTDGRLFTWGDNTYGQLGLNIPTSQVNSPAQVGTSSWSYVSAGTDFVAAIVSGGTNTLFTWGRNNFGQLGDGTTIDKSSPTQIGTNWLTVQAGQSFAAAISILDRSLYTWGVAAGGRLGNPTGDNRSSPTQIGTSSWSTISINTNGAYALALRTDGILFSWGTNTQGQLGLNDSFISRSSPTQVNSTSWNNVSAGINHAIALDKVNNFYGWGNNESGQLMLPMYDWVDISTSKNSSFTVAIRSDGSLWAWGQNSAGQLGNNSTIDQSFPVQIGTSSWTSVTASEDATIAVRSDGALFAWGTNQNVVNADNLSTTYSWSQVSVGLVHGLAIRSDGSLWVWGSNTAGQLGTNTVNNAFVAIQVGMSSWTAVAANHNDSSYAIRVDGALFAWGSGASGVLGDGTTINKSSPVQIGTSSWTQIDAGGNAHIHAIRTDGGLFSWGAGTSGALGNNAATARSSPVQIGTSSWTQVAGGGTNTFAIRFGGSLYAFGAGTGGGVGNSSTINRSSPVQLGTSSWTMVTSFNAIRSDGALFTWGTNNNGQLGNGATINRSSPVQIGSSSWTLVNNSGQGSASAIRTDGALFAWGSNIDGQLGNATTVNRSSPVQIGSSSWTQIDMGSDGTSTISFGIRDGGSLFAWGENGVGQLATNDWPPNRSSPVQVIAGTPTSSPVQIGTNSWSQVKSYIDFYAALAFDNTLYVWGQNFSGNLGTNSQLPLSVPTQLGTSTWSAISAGQNQMLAIRSDGRLFGWGSAGSGRLGDGTTINKSSPVQLGTGTWLSVASGLASSYGIDSASRLYAWGLNTSGQLGIGVTTNRSSPVQVGALTGWINVVAGGGFAFAYNQTNAAPYMWGVGTNFQLGTGNTSNRSSPVQLGSTGEYIGFGTTSNTVSLGDTASFAIWNQRVYAWGTGILGDGSDQDISPTIVLRNQYNSPTLISSSIGYSKISAGLNYNLLNYDTSSEDYLSSVGNNDYGQLGINSTVSQSSPVQLGAAFKALIPLQIGTSSWTSVDSGNESVIAIRRDGSLFTWGRNNAGQLGDSTTVNKSSPVQLGTSSWTLVSAGKTSFAAAIRLDGGLFTWGRNIDGELGDGTNFSRSSPGQVGTSSWSSISAGFGYSLAIRSDRALFAWGQNYYGQLGIDTLAGFGIFDPLQVGTSSWSQVSAGETTSVAIRSDGIVYGWGLNSSGQVGDGTTINKSSPTQVSSDRILTPISSPTQVGTSSWNVISAYGGSFGIRNDSLLYAWGQNYSGQLGLGDFTDRSSPVQVNTSSYVSVKTNQNITLAIDNNNQMQAAGDNRRNIINWGTLSQVEAGNNGYMFITSSGQLNGIGLANGGLLGTPNLVPGSLSISYPVQVGYSKWSQVAQGLSYGFGISSDGKLYAWGSNGKGLLGINNSSTVARSSPTQIGTSSWTTINSGQSVAVAIRSDGGLFTWGDGTLGGLGDGSTITKSSPVQIGTSSWSSVGGSGTWSSAAIRIDGALFTWGVGDTGQLGNNSKLSQSSPVLIGTSSWSQVSVGDSYVVAIRNDGALFTWGGNTSGQLGDGTTVNKSSPVQIGTSSWSSVDAGGSAIMAIRNDGILFAWGINTNGLLGDGTTINKSSPTQIGTFSWTQAKTFSANSIGLTVDGIMYAWGVAGNDQFGNDFFNPSRSAPAQLSGPMYVTTFSAYENLSNISQITVGKTVLGADDSSSLPYLWGSDNNGQVGNNSSGNIIEEPIRAPYAPTSVGSPTQIGTNSWTNVTAGNIFSMAIRNGGSLFVWGNNTSGQLGVGSTILQSQPTQLGTGKWTTTTTGGSFSLGLYKPY